jgi:hypothetical protein
VDIGNELYSLKEMFMWDLEDLSSKIFTIKLPIHQTTIFFQIKRVRAKMGSKHC